MTFNGEIVEADKDDASNDSDDNVDGDDRYAGHNLRGATGAQAYYKKCPNSMLIGLEVRSQIIFF